VQLVGITSTTSLVVAVLSNGAVEKHTLELSEPVGEERIGAASAHLSAHLTGTSRHELPSVPDTGDVATDALCAAALAALGTGEPELPEHVFVGGTSQVARAFDAIETVREVLGVLEQQYVVVTLLRDVIDRGLQVAIGTETGMAPLAECALIVAPFQAEGEPRGTIGVLGPSRMDYQQAIATVAVVSRRLSDRLSDG
jgi:heat-inducible transcriptional repressor